MVGASLAGSAFPVRLGHRCASITMIESQKSSRRRTCGERLPHSRLFAFAFLLCCFICIAIPALADSLNFPLDLNDNNTAIRFEVDSTWHLVKGKTSGVQGNIRLDDPSVLSSVRGEIRVPVASFDTDSSRRDKRMREVMAADNYTHVIFSIASAELSCTPESLQSSKPCNITLHGDLSIRGQSRPWNIPTTLTSSEGAYFLHGEAKLRWADFGVEDPSIIVAKLNAEVKVIIDARWKN